ncbi:MAG TPA: hypothetical protein ENJ27_01655 [Candidatus Moranbacteria bacterium]|nr:hypothetical protein [Candidatus Moranbacteria bacterium]
MSKNKKQKQSWIDDYSDAVKDFTYNHDPNSHQPFDAFYFYPYYFDLWLDKVYRAIVLVKSKGVADKEIFSQIPSLSSLRFVFYSIVNMTAYLKYSKTKSRVIIDFFLKCLSNQSKDKNIFHKERVLLRNNAELKKILATTKKAETKSDQQLISRLIGTLLMYNHVLYNDYSTDYGYWVEGPYKIDNKIILIRNYPDLAPKHLWPELRNHSLKNTQIITVYKNTPIRMQYMSSHLIAKNNYQNNLIAYQIFSNGKSLDNLSSLDQIIKDIAKTTNQLYEKVRKKNMAETKELFLRQQGYELKWLFDLAGLDWKPGNKKLKRAQKSRVRRKITPAKKPKTKEEYESHVGIDFLRNLFQKDITLYGKIANKGFAIGKAKIIKTPRDFRTFKMGDILVTKITNPSFVGIISKASAIITEQGGITSHPAIISREFNLPCLVGVKNATKNLLTDEYIEVNAYKGKVKVLQ